MGVNPLPKLGNFGTFSGKIKMSQNDQVLARARKFQLPMI